jgi:hypothetical protein
MKLLALLFDTVDRHGEARTDGPIYRNRGNATVEDSQRSLQELGRYEPTQLSRHQRANRVPYLFEPVIERTLENEVGGESLQQRSLARR